MKFCKMMSLEKKLLHNHSKITPANVLSQSFPESVSNAFPHLRSSARAPSRAVTFLARLSVFHINITVKPILISPGCRRVRQWENGIHHHASKAAFHQHDKRPQAGERNILRKSLIFCYWRYEIGGGDAYGVIGHSEFGL